MIVLDSSFLVACHNARDAHHAAAARVLAEIIAGRWGRGLLLEYVFLEVMTVLLVRRGLDVATRVGARLLEAREVDFVPCSEVFIDALHAFRTQRTGRLSFTDAAIVAVARLRGAEAVATFDADFRRLDSVRVVPA